MSSTRSREHKVEIRASREAVWKCLTDADEITRWYAPKAKVEPREGGRYWISWGKGMAGESRIDVLEPGKRLRLIHIWEGTDGLDEPLVEEYFLETKGELTVLRLVQSGIPAGSEWDAFYEDTGRGWRMFLKGLRHYLERHMGQPRESIAFMHPVRIDVEEAWKKLIGPEGLATEGGLNDVSVGQRRTLTTAFGQELDVEVLQHEPPHTLSMTIDNLADSLLALDFERIEGQTFLYANLSTFGVPQEQITDLRRRWKSWLDEIFPEPEEGAA